ncbi:MULTISPECIES: HD domain-containing protein [unclassified Xanthobacter]|uniref:HD domain-containing protein n=1 Tax=unclassified Xanthobacter TaxID=2623496 RepID=UPI001F359B06|nr:MULTISPECIES: HD domain-containing protein [unclassified Xanthobacter]
MSVAGAGAVTRARSLAEQLHAGQVDKAGAPYVGHLERVAGLLAAWWPEPAEAELEAAWLHDALEDTGATAESLLAAGVSPAAVEMVCAVTRPAGTAYLAWIGDLARTAPLGALRVKLADNADNSDPARVARLPDGARRVAERYAPARALLLEGYMRRRFEGQPGGAMERMRVMLDTPPSEVSNSGRT